MKHLKKYNESSEKKIDKIGLNSFDDDELRDRLEYLRIERDDIQNEMSTIMNILKDRKEKSKVDDIIQEMSDILLPLSDRGLDVNIVKLKSQSFRGSITTSNFEWVDQPDWMDIQLVITNNRTEFILGEYYSDLIRLFHYMKSMGFDSFIRFSIKGKGTVRYLFNDSDIIDEDGNIFNNKAIGIIKITFMKR
jgi:hypothetical protein